MPFRFRLSKRNFRRAALLGVSLPCLSMGGASALFYYKKQQRSLLQERTPLAPFPAPTANTRLLVFAPHCDDETLGCAGLLQQTLTARGSADVALFTNGDGYRNGVQMETRRLRLEPQDYIRFAEKRQQESLNALQKLGLSPQNVQFFGYPDAGLLSLWKENWSQGHPYISPSTKCYRSLYARTWNPKSRYCGANLLQDIKTLIRQQRPTLIAVTHPSDDHADHAAAAVFVARALQELQADPQEAKWAQKTKLVYYLIHRGDWPAKESAKHLLTPPPEMRSDGTAWQTLPITLTEQQQKKASIAAYPSQNAMMGKFLAAFQRQNEIFGELPLATITPITSDAIRLDGDTRDWQAIPTAFQDPVDDSLPRELQGGGDIEALSACASLETLYLRLEMEQKTAPRFGITLSLRVFDANNRTEPTAFTIRLNDTQALERQGIRKAIQNNQVEIAIPMRLLQGSLPNPPDTLGIYAQTSLVGMELDKTGVRLLRFLPHTGKEN